MQKPTMRIFLSAAIALAVSGAMSTKGLAGEIWVTNMTSGNVQVFDSDSHQKIATIEVGKGAHNVAISRDGKYALVSNVGAHTVSIIDAAAKKVIATVPAGKKTHDVSISPDGTRAMASSVGDSTITLIDVVHGKALYTQALGKNAMMAVFAAAT